MSMNKYMHPRNIYITPPNFKQLAIDYPEFRIYAKQDITGKVTLDFKDVNALRALSCTLLKKDFDLDVEMPNDKLIPTIPLRLNYLLWIEDLLTVAKSGEHIYGLDIGTGASCVYSLIAAKKFKWKMYATDVDKESVEYAKKNVSKNGLDNFIQVYQVSFDDTIFKEVIGDIAFSMCNPPFFSSVEELHPFFKSRNCRPHPRNAFCASVNEVVANGGEIDFISRMIRDSKKVETRVNIFTTMVGHKSSLVPLKKLLREMDITSFKQTEFCQGHTTRWGLAWTFRDIDLRKIPETTRNKPKPPLIYHIPKCSDENYKIEIIKQKILNVLSQLKIQVDEGKTNKNLNICIITAYSNTWSNQRRKRREQMREEAVSKSSSNTNVKPDISETSTQLAEMDIEQSSTPKRESEDDDEYFNDKKKFKTDYGPDPRIYVNHYAKATLVLRKDKSDINLELFSLDNTNRETLHQILQYIKNNLKISSAQ